MNPARRPQDALRQRRDGMNDFRKLVSSAVRCPFGEKNNVGVAEIEKGTIIRVIVNYGTSRDNACEVSENLCYR